VLPIGKRAYEFINGLVRVMLCLREKV
jgi:hypothetical protein